MEEGLNKKEDDEVSATTELSAIYTTASDADDEKNNANIEAAESHYKILLVGNEGCGKTTFAWRVQTNKFIEAEQTHGIDMSMFDYEYQTERLFVPLVLWDLSGRSEYVKFTKHYIKGVHGIFIAFDENDENWEKYCNDWFQIVSDANETKRLPPIILLGLKCDLPRNINPTDAHMWAKSHNAKYYEACAKTGLGIHTVIEYMIEIMNERLC